MKRKKRGTRAAGVLMATAGAMLVLRTTPLYVWYILLLGLVVLLALAVLIR